METQNTNEAQAKPCNCLTGGICTCGDNCQCGDGCNCEQCGKKKL